MNIVTTSYSIDKPDFYEMIDYQLYIDFITGSSYDSLVVFSDGTTTVRRRYVKDREDEVVAKVDCIGMENLLISAYIDGYAEFSDEDGGYIEIETGDYLGDSFFDVMMAMYEKHGIEECAVNELAEQLSESYDKIMGVRAA